jgi:CHAD domain-containing protein
MRTGDDAPLHGARIAVKRLRYAIETLAPAGEAALARRARDLQHALGDVHDAALLRDRIGRRVRRLREHGAEAGAAALGPLIELVEASRREALAAAREQAERLETRGHDRGLSVMPRTGADSA